jgi:hypothetical protein
MEGSKRMSEPEPYIGEIPPLLEKIKRVCKEIMNNKELIRFLWTHTRDESDYEELVKAICMLAGIEGYLYEWKVIPQSKPKP